MDHPSLEVIDICNILSRGLGKRVPNLIIQNHVVKRSITITSWGGGKCIHRINIQMIKSLSHGFHFSGKLKYQHQIHL